MKIQESLLFVSVGVFRGQLGFDMKPAPAAARATASAA